jgi:hypothetical protein
MKTPPWAIRPIEKYPVGVYHPEGTLLTGSHHLGSAQTFPPDRQSEDKANVVTLKPVAKYPSGDHRPGDEADVGVTKPVAKYSSGSGDHRPGDEADVGMKKPVAKYSSGDHRPTDGADVGVLQPVSKCSSENLPVDDVDTVRLEPSIGEGFEEQLNTIMKSSVECNQPTGEANMGTCQPAEKSLEQEYLTEIKSPADTRNADTEESATCEGRSVPTQK